jgi:hypothetical protein
LGTLLAHDNDERGGQQWGVWTPEDGAVRGFGELFRNVPYDVLESPELFAHSRWATHGSNEKLSNAHPFQVGPVIGCHNGIIYNHDELAKKYERNVEVDSLHIFHHMIEGRSFMELEGYGTIVWVVDGEPGVIFLGKMTTSADLALAFLRDDEGKTIGTVWSSDKEHLQAALEACDVDFGWWSVQEGLRMYVRDGILFNEDVSVAISPRRTSSLTSGGGRRRSIGFAHWRPYYEQDARAGQPRVTEEVPRRKFPYETYEDEWDRVYGEQNPRLYLGEALTDSQQAHYNHVLHGAGHPDEEFVSIIQALDEFEAWFSDDETTAPGQTTRKEVA